MLPLLGNQLTAEDGTPGMTMKVFTSPRSSPARECVDTIPLVKTELLLVDYTNDKITTPLWYADFEGW